jgi:amino acid adenylation domain-containing protein
VSIEGHLFRECAVGCSHHSVVIYPPGAVEAAHYGSRFAEILKESPFDDSYRVYHDAVPYSSTGVEGRARILREQGRCLPDTGELVLRAVTLSFVDAAVVVLTGPEATLDRAALERIGRLALSGDELDAMLETMWWDLPLRSLPDAGIRTRPAKPGTASRRHWEMPADFSPMERDDSPVLDVAALVHTLARHQAIDSVSIGISAGCDLSAHVLGASQVTRVVEVEVRPLDTLGDLVGRVERAMSRGSRDDGATGSDATERPHALVTYPSWHDGPPAGAASLRTGYFPGTRNEIPFVLVRPPADSGQLVALYSWSGAEHQDDEGMRRFVRDLASMRHRLTCTDATVPLSSLEFLSPAEVSATLALGDGGAVPTRLGSIPQAVARMALEHPDNVAVSFESERLTYPELDELGDRVAAGLTALGVTRGQTVGVCVRRSAEMIGLLLGILKCGAVYVPMDIGHPGRRIRFTCEDAGVRLLIADDSVSRAELTGLRAISPARLIGSPPDAAAGRAVEEPGIDDLAYIIYTSGSTGAPKGVSVTHGNVLSLLESTLPRMGITSADVWSQFHSVTFDFSVWEIWGCLCSGGRLVVVPYFAARSPDDFLRLLATEGVTVLNQTPTAFGELSHALRESLDDESTADRLRREMRVRRVIFGGEALDPRILQDWLRILPRRGSEMMNMYGITETTVHVTCRTLDRSAILRGDNSVGRAIAGWQISVRDLFGGLLPPGLPGEIYVGGAGVATGYHNRPELTAERFIDDRYTTGRIYRSGDSGILRADGGLDYLGRLDNQVKIRGHRVELGEIRSVLRASPEVRDAAVHVVRDDLAGARIDAYLVPAGAVAGAGMLAEVRGHAARTLPGYMMPSTWTLLDALPVTVNGKLDTHRLPPPAPVPATGEPAVTGEGTGPSGSAGDVVREAWRTLFGSDVSPDANFFDNGGTSLLALRLVRLLRGRAAGPVNVRDVYRHPTVGQLTTFLSEPIPVRSGAGGADVEQLSVIDDRQSGLISSAHRKAGTGKNILFPRSGANG